MGHKVNPYGFRLGVIYPWKSKWYGGREYAQSLHEDVKIRQYITRKLTRAGISSVDNESDLHEPVRLIVNLKKDADPDVVLNQLYKFSPLQESQSMIMLALVDRKAKKALRDVKDHRIQFYGVK